MFFRQFRDCFVHPIRQILLCFLLIAFSTAPVARTESELKAAYLYQFIKFVTWPDEPNDTPFRLCILGENPFDSATEKLSTRQVRGRPIVVSFPEPTEINTACEIAYLTAMDGVDSNVLLERLAASPVLTISDLPGFIHRGGIIEFVRQGNVLRFAINLKQARAVHLDISAKLLKLAIRVIQ